MRFSARFGMSLVVLSCSLIGCVHDSSLWGKGDNNGNSDWPEIEVTPNRHDFGPMSYEQSDVQTFTIKSVGEKNSVLNVERVEFESGGGGSFTILEDDLSFNLPSGQEATFTVQFTALDPNEQEATIKIVSDAKNESVANVFVEGEGKMPELTVSPETQSYGEMYVECEKEAQFTLTNTGNDVLTVDEIEHTGEGYTVLDAPRTPFILDPGEFETVSMLFSPSDDVEYHGTLRVDSTDPEGVREAHEIGVGAWPTSFTDLFEIPANPKGDILWFVDQSKSIEDDRLALIENFEDFIRQLEDFTTDWQMIVVTDDDGCSASGIIRPEMPNYQAVFEEAVFNDESGAYEEAGLYIAAEAVKESREGGCNEGFVRDGALLHVINVTDEPEQSPMPWSYYTAEMLEAKNDLSMYFRVSAVAGDMPSGCEDPYGDTHNSAMAADGYYYAALATGGTFASICSNWSNNVRELAEATINQSTFILSDVPDPSTIEVVVNGALVTNGWAYDADSNAVVFQNGHAPSSGDVIEISGTRPYVCD